MGLNLATSTISFFFVSLLELLFIVAGLLYFKFKKYDLKTEFWSRLSPKKRSIKRRILDILIGIGVGTGFYFIATLWINVEYNIIYLITGPEFLQTASNGTVNVSPPNLTILDLVVSLIIAYILVGFSEEFFFRGVLLKEIANKSGSFKRGALISALVFAFYHVFPGIVPIESTLVFLPYYFIIGLMFAALVYFQKGDLLSAIIAHGTFDAIILILNFIS